MLILWILLIFIIFRGADPRSTVLCERYAGVREYMCILYVLWILCIMDGVDIVYIAPVAYVVDIVDIVDNADMVDIVDICGYSGTLIHVLLYYVNGTLASLDICEYCA